MFKQTWIIIPIITIMQLNGMDDPMEIETAMVTTKCVPNFFSKLPTEILDIIAHYLIFNDIETEDEFIERTKKMSKIRVGKELSIEKTLAYQIKYPSTTWAGYKTNSFVTHYPKANRIAILQELGNQSSLIIVAADTEQELNKVFFDSGRGCYYYTASSGVDLFATLHSESDNKALSHSCCDIMAYKDVLTVIDIASQQKQVFVIPEYFSLANLTDKAYPSAVAFNKQKTHIIMHGMDNHQFSGSSNDASDCHIMHHMIVPLTITMPSASPDKKTLQHYFAQKGICKEIK